MIKARRTSKTKRSRWFEEPHCKIDRANHTIYICGELDFQVASTFRRHLRSLEKSARQIIVEINSPGGDIEAGLMMIDTIDLCNKKVTTRVTGQAMSMAAMLLACGHVREALPNSTIMVHQGSYSFRVPYDEIDTEVAEIKRVEKLCANLLDLRTGQEPGFWDKKCAGKNLYITPEEALALNLIDKITKRK